MIKFKLGCDNGHEFEIWFGSSQDFDNQKERKLLTCPNCGSSEVEKMLMAPSVTTGRKKDQMVQVANMQNAQKEILTKMRELRDKVIETGEDVGSKFPEEARKIHYGETEARGIYGQASMEEATELAEEGVEFLPLPELPEDQN